jgi:hypothetical protein
LPAEVEIREPAGTSLRNSVWEPPGPARVDWPSLVSRVRAHRYREAGGIPLPGENVRKIVVFVSSFRESCPNLEKIVVFFPFAMGTRRAVKSALPQFVCSSCRQEGLEWKDPDTTT